METFSFFFLRPMHGIALRFPMLAQAPYRLSQAHRQRRNRFEPLLAARGQADVALSSHFCKQQLGIAQASPHSVIELVAQHLAQTLISNAAFVLSLRFRKACRAERSEE